MGETLVIGDFGNIVFFISKRNYTTDATGKLTYKIVKEPFSFEGMEIIDTDKTRIWIEGLDKDDLEVFNIRRNQVVSFEKQEKPK